MLSTILGMGHKPSKVTGGSCDLFGLLFVIFYILLDLFRLDLYN